MLDLFELQVFLVAAETENFSATGRILGISQPAVSGHIQSLEQRLKTQVFERAGRHIKLNDVGEALVPIARNLLREVQQVEDLIARRRGMVVGQLAIGCSTAAGKYVLPRVMARFMEKHPEVRIVCDIGPRGQALDRLCAGEIDLAVSSLRIPRRAIEYRHFSDDVLVLIAPPGHPWAEKGCIKPEELIEHPIILREANSGTAITLDRGLAQFDMSIDMLQSRLTLHNTEAIAQAVAEGIGPGFVSWMPAQAIVRQGLAVEVRVEGLHLAQRLYMARHTGFHASDAQIAFWNFTFAPENEDLRQLLK